MAEPSAARPVAPAISARRFGNYLLDGLPATVQNAVASVGELVELERGDVLQRPGHAAAACYFPTSAVLWSYANTTRTDRPTTYAVGARRGVFSLSRILGIAENPTFLRVLQAGAAWRLPWPALARLSDESPPLHDVLHRFAFACLAVNAMRSACNGEHNVDLRTIRWILTLSDETESSELGVRQQDLSDISGIRRPSVSQALSDMNKAGLIQTSHGALEIVDRTRLEEEVCPCYRAIRRALDAAATPASG